jgi:hypothetical protein
MYKSELNGPRDRGGRDSAGSRDDLGQVETEIFLQIGLDGWNQIDLVQKISFWAQRVLEAIRGRESR